MALKIRLRQQGRNNRQTYRLVVADIRSPRDGKYIEKLGWYNPVETKQESLSIDAERLNYWIEQGAQISEQVQSLMSKATPTLLSEWRAKKQQKRTKEVAQRRTLRRAKGKQVK